MENKKKKKWPIILLVVLLLLGGGGCFAYFNNYLDPIGLPFKAKTEEETLKAEEQNPEETKKEEVKVNPVQEIKRDYSNINGKWESEKRNNGQYLTFEIDYPKVINFNDEIGSIEEKSIGSKYQYTVYLKDGYGRLKLFIKDLDYLGPCKTARAADRSKGLIILFEQTQDIFHSRIRDISVLGLKRIFFKESHQSL